MDVVALTIGLAVGALGAWLVARARAASVVARLETELAHEREDAAGKAALLEQARRDFADAFRTLSTEAAQASNASLVALIKAHLDKADSELAQRQRAVEQLVAPIRESLEKVDGKIQLLEQSRREAYGALVGQLRSLADSQDKLRVETSSLVTALRAPHVRGRWGEIQLKRVVELAGMVAHCDFVEQATATDSDGRLLRPDLVVKLPGGKHVVVDAKVPLAAYLDGIEAQDDELRRLRLQEHARQVREHIGKLGAKSYWRQFSPAPDFVVMFMPDESFFRAALEHDPSLIEAGVDAGVLPASPTTLIALLRTVAYGWQQETVAESARAVGALGRELYERLATMARHFGRVGRALDSAVGAYNETVGSLETRVLVTARKFEDHGVPAGDIPDLQPLERQARPLQAVELAHELPAADVDAA